MHTHYCVAQLGARNRLGHVAMRAASDDVDDVLVSIRDGECEESHLGTVRRHRIEHRPTSSAGEMYVEQHDVGLEGQDSFDRCGDVGRLADDVDPVMDFGTDTGTNHCVVVDDEDPGPPAHE